MFINFEQSNSGLQRYGTAINTYMMTFAAEDFLWMILMANFWLSQTNRRLNQLIQELIDCLLSI
jgi:hypothetical protein